MAYLVFVARARMHISFPMDGEMSIGQLFAKLTTIVTMEKGQADVAHPKVIAISSFLWTRGEHARRQKDPAQHRPILHTLRLYQLFQIARHGDGAGREHLCMGWL